MPSLPSFHKLRHHPDFRHHLGMIRPRHDKDGAKDNVLDSDRTKLAHYVFLRGVLDTGLPGRAEVQNSAAAALGIMEMANALAVQHQNLVVIIDLLGVPVGRKLGGKY